MSWFDLIKTTYELDYRGPKCGSTSLNDPRSTIQMLNAKCLVYTIDAFILFIVYQGRCDKSMDSLKYIKMTTLIFNDNGSSSTDQECKQKICWVDLGYKKLMLKAL